MLKNKQNGLSPVSFPEVIILKVLSLWQNRILIKSSVFGVRQVGLELGLSYLKVVHFGAN